MRAGRRRRYSGYCRFLPPQRIDLVVVGPEAPLVAGLVDALEARGHRRVRPGAAAAAARRLQGLHEGPLRARRHSDRASRRFTRCRAAQSLCRRAWRADRRQGGRSCRRQGRGRRRDARGGARGNRRRRSAAGSARPAPRSSIEEFLAGEEASFFALVDGRPRCRSPPRRTTSAPRRRHRPQHRRHGRLFAGAGASPGDRRRGHGAIVCRPCGRWRARHPVQGRALRRADADRPGPKLLEYNVRFGDPESQALLMRLKSDLLPALLAAHDGVLRDDDLRWATRRRCAS